MSEIFESELLREIKGSGSLKTYQVKESATIGDYLNNIGLESKFFAILVDGKRVNLDYKAKKGQDITILPKIAGGHKKTEIEKYFR